MNFKDCPLRNELKEGLLEYERDTNLSSLSLIESLVERYLYDEGYLVTGAECDDVAFPTELNSMPSYVYIEKNGKYRIRKKVDGKMCNFGTYNYDVVKDVYLFLENEGWDLKYTNSQTHLKGEEHEQFMLKCMEEI